jgi:hypothetical protein
LSGFYSKKRPTEFRWGVFLCAKTLGVLMAKQVCRLITMAKIDPCQFGSVLSELNAG